MEADLEVLSAGKSDSPSDHERSIESEIGSSSAWGSSSTATE